MTVDRLVNVLTAARVLGPCDIEFIAKRSQAANALHGVTGLLVYNGVNFMQHLEGAEEAIASTFTKIKRDDRHAGIRVIAHDVQSARDSSDWWMHVVEVPQDATDLQRLLPMTLPSDLQQAFASLARLTAV